MELQNMQKTMHTKKLVRIEDSCVVYTTTQGQILVEDINPDAKVVLDWYVKHIPANDK